MSRATGYCFTVNNYTDEDAKAVDELAQSCDYAIYGYEIGNQGTDHIQGYIYKRNKISFNTIKRCIPRAHIEIARGSPKSNQQYCSKGGNYEEYGFLPRQGSRNDIAEFRDAILEDLSEEEILMNYPEMMAKYDRFYQRCRNIVLKKKAKKMYQPEVIVITGDPGSGKTRHVYDNNNHEDIYKMEVGDGSANSIFWDNYNGESVILIDDFHNNFKLDYMLRLLDRYPMKLNIKGSHTWKCAKKIYITSNIETDRWYPNCPEIHRKALYRRITKRITMLYSQTNNNMSDELLHQTLL